MKDTEGKRERERETLDSNQLRLNKSADAIGRQLLNIHSGVSFGIFMPASILPFSSSVCSFSSFREASEQFQSSFRAIPEQFQMFLEQFFWSNSEPFQSNFAFVLGQFQSNFRAVSEQFHMGFGAVSDVFRAISHLF